MKTGPSYRVVYPLFEFWTDRCEHGGMSASAAVFMVAQDTLEFPGVRGVRETHQWSPFIILKEILEEFSFVVMVLSFQNLHNKDFFQRRCNQRKFDFCPSDHCNVSSSYIQLHPW